MTASVLSHTPFQVGNKAEGVWGRVERTDSRTFCLHGPHVPTWITAQLIFKTHRWLIIYLLRESLHSSLTFWKYKTSVCTAGGVAHRFVGASQIASISPLFCLSPLLFASLTFWPVLEVVWVVWWWRVEVRALLLPLKASDVCDRSLSWVQPASHSS